MDDQDREEVFLINATLGTDLATSYVAATDNDPKKPRQGTHGAGCLVVLLLALLAVVLALR